MRSFLEKSAFGVVLLFGWILPQSEAIFPVELIRVVMLLPSTVNVASPRIAYFVLALTIKLFLIAFWLGFPRTPPRPNVRSIGDEQTLFPFYHSHFHDSPISQIELEAFLDKMSQLDEETCLRRLFCHLESLPGESLSFVQKIVLKVLWMSASPSWNYSAFISPRRDFINAAYFAKTTKCSSCCQVLYKKCPAETETLLQII